MLNKKNLKYLPIDATYLYRNWHTQCTAIVAEYSGCSKGRARNTNQLKRDPSFHLF